MNSVTCPRIPLLGGGTLLLVFAATWQGRSAGLGAILWCSLACGNRAWFRRMRGRFYGILPALAPVLVLFPRLSASSGTPRQGAPVRNCSLQDRRIFPRFSPWNVIPEIDQVRVGVHPLPCADPFADRAQGRRVRSLLLPLCEEMEKDPDFRALGSVLSASFRELARMAHDLGHCYAFSPEVSAGERLPCIVFLHGSGGNFKVYLRAPSRAAARYRCAVVAPTFGFGNWQKPGGDDLVVQVAQEALKKLSLDPERLCLAGLSTGGIGVSCRAIRG